MLLVAALLAGFAPSAGVAEPTAAASGSVQVEFRDGLLTLDVRDAPLDDVLRTIGKKAGFEVVIKVDLSTPVSRSFAAMPLDQGIRRLIGETSFVMAYGGSGDAVRLTLLSPGASDGGTEIGRLEVTAVDEPSQADIEEWILSRLTQPDRGVRIVAVRRLMRLERELAVDIAARVLDHDDDPAVRGEAAAVLGQIGGDRAAILLDLAVADAEASVRIHAVRALGALGGEAAVHGLGRALLEHPDRDVRLIAAEGLAENSSEASQSYLEAAKSVRDAKVREAAEKALDHRVKTPLAVRSVGETENGEYRGDELQR